MSAFQGVLRMASRVLRSVFHLDPSGARTYVRRKQKIILEQNDVQSHLFDVSPRWMFWRFLATLLPRYRRYAPEHI
jgi:hypothetical protein